MGDRFRDFCQEFSNAYPGDAVKELRFLLHDHLSVGVLAEEHYSGMTLFNELQNKGSIAYNDVTIMSDIAYVTENVAAKASVKKYKESVGKQYDDSGPCKASLSLQRKTLYEAMIAITENTRGDLHNLIQFYRLKALGFTNKWDLVFHLEKELELNTQKKLAEFARQLHKGPRTTLLGEEDQGASANVGGGELVDDQAQGGCGKIVRHPKTQMDEDDFQLLKMTVSDYYDAITDGFIMLMVLFGDYVPKSKHKSIKNTISLLNALGTSNDLSSNNICIIFDTINLTGHYALESKIQKSIPSFPNVSGIEIKQISSNRQKIMSFGMGIGESDVAKIDGLKNNPLKNYESSWSMIYDLECREIIKVNDNQKFIAYLTRVGLSRLAEVLK